jgi:hypothetical protein
VCIYSLANVEFEGDPSLCNVHSRPVVRMLKDGVAVEPGVAFQHHKPETTVLQISFIVWYALRCTVDVDVLYTYTVYYCAALFAMALTLFILRL